MSEIGDVGDNEWDRNGSTTCLQELEDNASINALGEAADCAHERQRRPYHGKDTMRADGLMCVASLRFLTGFLFNDIDDAHTRGNQRF